MLFGNSEFLEKLENDRKHIENKYKVKCIFGSTIGSISRGISREDSDYDIRYLFVDERYTYICQSDLHKEEKIRIRMFKEKDSPYDCIAFWESSAFINFLCEPFIDQGLNYKLFRNVLWTFLSPYCWDPYGIKAKVMPFIEACVVLDYEKEYQYKTCKEIYAKEKNIKNYVYCLHSFLSFEWMVRKNCMPPLDINALLYIIEEGDLKKECYGLMNKYNKTNVYNYNGLDVELSFPTINSCINDFVLNNVNLLESTMGAEKFKANQRMSQIINEIIFFSINQRIIVEGVTN